MKRTPSRLIFHKTYSTVWDLKNREYKWLITARLIIPPQLIIRVNGYEWLEVDSRVNYLGRIRVIYHNFQYYVIARGKGRTRSRAEQQLQSNLNLIVRSNNAFN